MSSTKLEYLAMKSGYNYRAHRAVSDAYATIALLDRFASATKKLWQKPVDTYQLLAVGSPFASKDALKARGYRWNERDRLWWRELSSAQFVLDEMKWLKSNVYTSGGAKPKLNLVSAHDRFSGRLTREATFNEIYDACGIAR